MSAYHTKKAAKPNRVYTIALEEIGTCMADSRTVETEMEAQVNFGLILVVLLCVFFFSRVGCGIDRCDKEKIKILICDVTDKAI